MKRSLLFRILPVLIFIGYCLVSFTPKERFQPEPPYKRIEILFLGHNSKHHDSEKLADIFSKEFFMDGINISYTTEPDDLNEKNLEYYDGLILYANYDSITLSQEKALLNFVRNGKGFIPIHSASYCFRNSDEVVEMIGGQFKTHKYDSFPSAIRMADHPVMNGINTFYTKDETYVHDKISNKITVLTERVEGDHREPYTWVRDYGKGRVFYTAYGHDDNTFNNPAFIQLVKNGLFWAIGDETSARLRSMRIPKPVYTNARIPNYERRDPPPKLQQPLTPEESMKLMQVPVGFELQLFAAEPDIINPIYMNWDEKGRLWVIETVDYPNTVREDKESGDDRIKIMEDTDGDGRADRIKIFADKLNIPTSFTFSKGGIIVTQAPYILYLKDTDGDDVADIRDTLMTGWGTFDTHAGPSNLRYGFDNRMWGVVGYSGFRGKVDKDSLRFGSGLFSFNADGKKLEFLSTTSNNTWGLGFSEENDVFISTANNTHSGFYGIPFRQLQKADIRESGIEKIDNHYGMHVVTKNLRQVDVFGGFTAAAGHSLYTAREFPKEYWNRVAFITEPTGRLIHKHILEQSGSGFKEKGDGWNMLASADEWAGPVQAEVGPDGSVWILDRYDFIIQHNPTPEGFENGKGNAYIIPLRDHERGRIYKLRYKNAEPGKKYTLDKNDVSGLVQALKHNNMFWRITAQRLLVESGNTSILPQLYDLVRDTIQDGAGINAPAIHALWTMQGLKALEGTNKEALKVATDALMHPSAGVRKAAVMVLPKSNSTLKSFTNKGIFNDADLRVRLAVLLAVNDMKSNDQLGTVLLTMASKPQNAEDSRIRQAMQVATIVHKNGFKEALKKKGLSENAPLGQMSLVQRMAAGERLKSMNLWYGFNERPERSPDVKGKEFSLTGILEKTGDRIADGIVIAHGDKQDGYVVYIDKGKLNFTINQDGKPFVLKTPATVPDSFGFKAVLLQNGVARLLVNKKQLASAKTSGLLKQVLPVGIRVGMDNNIGENKVAAYPDTSRMRNRLRNLKLETLDPAGAIASAASAKPDQVITINVLKNVMKFDKELITVKAGTNVQLILNNPDFMQHNLVLIKPNTTEKVGAAADKMAVEADGAKLNYIPKMPEVLFATPLVNPEGKYVLKIKVPSTPGDYPYLCTFPGHWRIMKGVMRVR